MLRTIALVVVIALPCLTQAGTHPRLVFSPSYVASVRANELSNPRLGRLTSRLGSDLGDVVLPGEVLAAAALHLIAPGTGGDAARIDLIGRSLANPNPLGPDLLECVLALDWCWSDLSVTDRQEFLRRMEVSPLLLDESDSPLDFATFRDKLAYLALALAVDEQDFRSTIWAEARPRILRAANEYLLTALPNYLVWRGGVPTSSALSPWEESNTAWALELGSVALRKNLWAEQPRVANWLEHYVMVQRETRPLDRHLLRDDGDAGYAHPGAHPGGLLPMTAHLWAARTGNPAAVHLARRLETTAKRHRVDPILWSWLQVALPLDSFREADLTQLPKLRNLDGAVVMRTATAGREFTLWIDTGGNHLRSGQHFDAGHFLLQGDGPLLTDAGADVALEAVGSKRGEQRLGNGAATFPFEQFSIGTIAHNCLLIEEAARLEEWKGKPYVPRGGQRLIDGNCRDYRTPIEAQKRDVGRLVAYGQTDGACYAALDLSSAYDARILSGYTRAFLLLWDKVLLVVDIPRPARSAVQPVWVAQLPVAPDVRNLDERLQVRGTESNAGVWRIPGGDWIRTTSRSGTLAIRSLLPQERVISLVGGPASRERIMEGNFAGRSYVGGSADSFERLVAVSTRDHVGNAWFRLGAPTGLGPDFGGQTQPLWGRVEIEGQASNRPQMFVTALVLEPGDQPLSQVRITEEPGGALLFLRDGTRAATVQFEMRDKLNGFVVVDPDKPAWELPTGVGEDPPLPSK